MTLDAALRAQEVVRRLGTRVAHLASRRVALDALAVAFIVHVARVLSVRLTISPISNDENWFVWSGWALLKGAVPYRDFHAFKPPMVYLTNAAAIALLGLDGARFRYFFQALAVGSLALLMISLLRRGVDRIVAGTLVLLITGLYFDQHYHDSGLNDSESIGLAYYFIGVAFLVWPRHWATSMLGGAFLAACVLTKEPFSFCVAPTWVAFLVDDRYPLHRKNLLAYALPSLGGAASVVCLTLAHLVISGGLPHYVHMSKLYLPFAQTYCVTLGRFKLGTFAEEQTQNWNFISGELFVFARLGAWIPFIAAAFATITRKRVLHIVLVVVAAFGAICSVTVGHCFWPHYYILAFAGLALLAVTGALGLSVHVGARRGKRAVRNWARLFLAATAYAALTSRYDAEASAKYTPLKYGGLSAEYIDFLRANSDPDDYVLTTGAPGVYVYADRRSPAESVVFLDELLVLYPGTTDLERLAPLREELVRTKPKVVIIDPQSQQRATRFLASGIMPFLTQMQYRQATQNMWIRP